MNLLAFSRMSVLWMSIFVLTFLSYIIEFHSAPLRIRNHHIHHCYYINYFNKTTTWDDPRLRFRQLNQIIPQHVPAPTVIENIPLQPHGSPDSRGYHVYPTSSSHFIPQPAFQNPAIHGHSSVHFQDFTNVRPSPIQSRSHIQQTVTPYSSPARTMETTMTTDTEQSVAKISAMFPTVTDTHIKTLLMKYHNREAVVMSALRVEKYPISTPGPYATPPLQGRHFHGAAMGVYCGLQMTPPLGFRDGSRTGSPIQRPGSGGSGSLIATRPHSSPKMKLRYLKSVFPKVEETLLLDILSNSDNNVQKATEKLLTMGFEKRDTPPPRLTLRKKEEEQKSTDRPAVAPTPPPRMKSLEEKQKMKGRLQEMYQDIPERVVTIALDSVDYDEERAAQILQFMVQEEKKTKRATEQKPSAPESQPKETKPLEEPQPSTSEQPTEPVPESSAQKTPVKKTDTALTTLTDKNGKGPSRRPKGKKDVPKVSRGTSTTEDKEYKSPYIIKTGGPDPSLHKGPNDDLLLVDYVTWNGPNPDFLHTGDRVSLAKGPDKSLLGARSYIPKGPNSEFRKGPLRGLAKGSIYSQLNGNVNDESRGK